MYKLLCLLLACHQVCLGNVGSLSSESASYQGDDLVLKGNVVIEHTLGKMQADSAVMKRRSDGEGLSPITSLELSSSINITLTDEATLSCEKAYFDFKALTATLSSPTNIHYSDQLRRKDKKTPFEFFTPSVTLQMQQIPSSYQLTSIHASNGVHLVYDALYHLHADALTFKDHHITSSSEGCVWSYLDDELKAHHFDLNLSLEELLLYQVSGSLHTLTQEKIMLRSECIDFKHQENTLFLKGFSVVELPALGCLSSSQEIKLFLENHLTADLYTTGVTTIKSITGDHLTSYGPIHVHSLSHTITAHPSSCQTPILYEGEEILLEAQQAILTYEEGGKLFSPHQLELEGHIKIVSKEALSHQIQALADHVSYHPFTKNCILKSHPGSKVLITQESTSLKMSADEIHLIYDPFAKEYSIQGLGCVSFSLSATEQQLLNQVFHDKKHASSS